MSQNDKIRILEKVAKAGQKFLMEMSMQELYACSWLILTQRGCIFGVGEEVA